MLGLSYNNLSHVLLCSPDISLVRSYTLNKVTTLTTLAGIRKANKQHYRLQWAPYFDSDGYHSWKVHGDWLKLASGVTVE